MWPADVNPASVALRVKNGSSAIFFTHVIVRCQGSGVWVLCKPHMGYSKRNYIIKKKLKKDYHNIENPTSTHTWRMQITYRYHVTSEVKPMFQW